MGPQFPEISRENTEVTSAHARYGTTALCPTLAAAPRDARRMTYSTTPYKPAKTSWKPDA
ncbi:MAG: hypothetical protein LBD89_05725 [Tannerellaceae bacterium]|nr:hypothetical protein [Tannerellaceae bacterium]